MRQARWSRSQTIVPRSKLRSAIANYSTEPFADVVAFLLNCRPEQKEVEEWASKNPDKWANAIKIFSNLAGFAEKTEVQHNHVHQVANMSDAQVLAKLTELRQQMLLASPAEYQESHSKIEKPSTQTEVVIIDLQAEDVQSK